jgi:hypothetical protein
MSSPSSQVSVPDLHSWLLPTTETLSYAGRKIPATELLADPYAALGIASHESDLWSTHARIELASETEATVTITMKGAGGTDRLRFALVQLPGEHSAAEPPGRVTLEYAPGDSERLPWLIRVDGESVVRASDGDYVTSALVVVPQLISEGWTVRQAVDRALSDHTAIATDQWEAVSAE